MGSMIRFDYAAVSETSPTVVSSAAGTATPTPFIPGPSASTTTSHSALSIGPIIGGAVGGLAVIAAVIFALLCYRRQRQPSHKAAVLDPQPHLGFDTRQTAFNPSLALYGSQLPSSIEYSQPLTYMTPFRSSVPNSSDYSNDKRANPYLPSVSSGRTHSTSAVPQSNTGRQSNTLSTDTQLFAGAHPDTRALPHTAGSHSTESRPLESQTTGSSSPPSTKFARSSELTEEQAVFINDLRNANVPSAEIAHLMEVMRRQREEASGTFCKVVSELSGWVESERKLDLARGAKTTPLTQQASERTAACLTRRTPNHKREVACNYREGLSA
ncbi:hypothetical protein PILCRDRAFT_89844 [Piloderma croceum F 1598]|uniref:Uncharacterized protein n=1 Tax=Piloderma croceum (strain F 1598) TaxID=765440 RepID=A0A0C3BRK1_PILCF|nr:hypothetical protein PILCRDRAFT_89844 [Piloderma croceum F 1598]